MLGRNEKNNRDITIIGGGPSGMIAAISAARIAGGCKVNLLEKNPSLGRKLLATGNGRCNFSNSHCSYEDFKDFSKDTFQGFGVEETLAFFEGLGVYMVRVKKSYSFDKMFAVIFLISAVSLLLMKLVDLLGKASMPWEKERKK